MCGSSNSFLRRGTLLGGLLLTVLGASAATRDDATPVANREAGLVSPPADESLLHTHLVKSIPGKDSVLRSRPATVQLWFSEKIELGLSRVRIEGADGRSISASPLTQAADVANAPVVASIASPLADGTYTLHWTAASGDGHAVKGSFSFTVTLR